jgi:uncharacterized protein (DUF39 family)
MTRSYDEINEKIRKGKAVVLTAEEVSEMAKTMTPKEILEKVDVVTTATFGAMCSSGALLNFGHSTPPIRMERIEINGVPVTGGLAAVDTFVGATDCNMQNPTYGGAHIIQDLIDGKENVRPLVSPDVVREISIVIRRDFVRERILNEVANAVKKSIPEHMIDSGLKKFAIRI